MSENEHIEKLNLSDFIDRFQLSETQTDMVKMYARYISEAAKLNRQLRNLKKYLKAEDIPIQHLEVA